MDIDELRPFRNRMKELLEFKSSPDEEGKLMRFMANDIKIQERF